MSSESAQPAQSILQQASELHRQGRRREAIALFEQGLSADPAAAEAHYEFGYALKAEGRYEDALAAFRQAVAQGVTRAHEVHLNAAVLLADHLLRDDEAQQELEAALALVPDYLPAQLNLGNLHEQRGRREEALAIYAQVLRDADQPGADPSSIRWVAQARSAIMRPPTTPDDPILTQLHTALARAGNDHSVRANLYFALGQSHDRLGAHDQAFDAFAKGNRSLLRLAGRRYDPAHASRLSNALIEAFPHRAAAVEAAETGPEPLFICGMFRSGSTLIERVLAAHRQIIGGGELDWLLRVAAQRLAPFPASMATLAATDLTELAQEYRAHLARLFPQARPGMYITDKRPDNYQLIGFIKCLFPNARIIHTTRHPVDNGLSVFMQNINLEVAPYAYDLAAIGHHYGEYRRLMAHWQTLYPDSIVDFSYDQFVADPKPALRALLDFLELDWDDDCLAFHRQPGTVKTASYWQVRRPLYAEASGRWQKYETHLGPLLSGLDAAGVAR